jgi:hypothetical protein
LKNFGYIAFALDQDFQRARSISERELEFGYIPRGFVSDWLKPNTLKKRERGFKISVDSPVRPHKVEKNAWNSDEAMKELDDALAIVSQNTRLDLVVSSRVHLQGINSIKLRALPVREFYKQFFVGSDLYIGPQLSKSRHSESKFFGDSYQGLYENQIVEAQLAGAMVLGEEFGIHEELLAPSQVSIPLNFDDKHQMAELILECLSQSNDKRDQILNWARLMHDSKVVMRSWKQALELI